MTNSGEYTISGSSREGDNKLFQNDTMHIDEQHNIIKTFSEVTVMHEEIWRKSTHKTDI